MEIIPAIDLRAGKVVRLAQGDYARQTTFADDPVAVAQEFAAAGAPRIHVVDLDGAHAGEPVHLGMVRRICRAVPVPVQLGGGMRNEQFVAQAFQAEAQRVVLGTLAALAPNTVDSLVAEHGADRLIVSLDVRNDSIAVSSWAESSGFTAPELMSVMTAKGIRRFVYTDIARDGTLTSPNFDGVSALVEAAQALGSNINVIASGGVATLDHLRRLAQLGVEAAIVGSAIYEGSVDLAEAVAELGGE